jgi:DNA-binding response OmpR family regulator
MKLLAIEDSQEAQKLIEIALKNFAFVTFASDLKSARQLLKADRYDLILLDLNLPDGNGLDLCQELQLYPYRVPVIVVSGKSEVSDRVVSLVAGADDYINKPFDARELQARIDSVLRRSAQAPKTAQMKIGSLDVNLLQQRVACNGSTVDLTPIEYRILVALGQSLNTVLSREDMYERLWGEDVHVSQRNIDAHVSKLRRKIQDLGFVIHSKRGEGYALVFTPPTVKAVLPQPAADLPRGM